MPEMSLTGILVVAAVAFGVPLGLGLLPSVRVPSVVVEILAGVLIGPTVLGLVEVDPPLEVLALIGLAFLLFLAGFEIDLGRLRGGRLRDSSVGFALSLALALGAAIALRAAGLIESPLFVGIMLSATALGIVVPVLADAEELESTLGQQVIAAASIADFAAVILLSLFFWRSRHGCRGTLAGDLAALPRRRGGHRRGSGRAAPRDRRSPDAGRAALGAGRAALGAAVSALCPRTVAKPWLTSPGQPTQPRSSIDRRSSRSRPAGRLTFRSPRPPSKNGRAGG